MRINVTLSKEAEKEIKNYKDENDLNHFSDERVLEILLENMNFSKEVATQKKVD